MAVAAQGGKIVGRNSEFFPCAAVVTRARAAEKDCAVSRPVELNDSPVYAGEILGYAGPCFSGVFGEPVAGMFIGGEPGLGNSLFFFGFSRK